MRGARSQRITLLAIVSMTIAMAGCSQREPAASAATPPASSVAATPSPPATRTACTMVTAAEMSTILGATVGAESDEGGGSTTCSYRPSDRSMPFVQVKVEWGGGHAAMVAMRMMGRLEPGMANALAGLGDDASAIGPAFMVRTGEDLVNLTVTGVDDHVATAKRIIDTMRKRTGNQGARGPEGQGEQGARGPGDQGEQGAKGPGAQGGDSPEARASQVVGALLGQLARDNHAPSREDGAGASTARRAAAASAPADEVFSAAKGPSPRIPLVAGLTLVGAEYERDRGDYEPIFTVTTVAEDAVSMVFSADLPEGKRVVVDRVIRRDDLKGAREYRPWFVQEDPATFPGTTAFGVSAEVHTDLKAKGRADVTLVFPVSNPLLSLASQLSGAHDVAVRKEAAPLERVEPHALAVPVLVNDQPAQLPAIHARGRFNNETIDFYVLDDAENPLVLLVAGSSRGRIVRIAFPTPDAAPIEEKLKKDARVELHGIYFDFGKATIRSQSEPVLRDIAAALTRNPEWKIGIEGHTDDIGGEAVNLDLSRRRADAVKQALVDRYRIAASNLTTAGFGASRPKASNDTMSGRARNRRVELVRQ